MKPNLFADDLSDTGDALIWNSDMNEALKRILPRRCPCATERARGIFREDYIDPGCQRNPSCGGDGWLYPEMPKWWGEYCEIFHTWLPERDPEDAPLETIMWEDFCQRVYRVMRILDET